MRWTAFNYLATQATVTITAAMDSELPSAAQMCAQKSPARCAIMEKVEYYARAMK